MPHIFELFGFRVEDRSEEATAYRQAAVCPFMDADCDGGGNRYLSNIDLREKPALREYFLGRGSVPSGICSLQLTEDGMPWIVCPRRLLVLGRANVGRRAYQYEIESMVLGLSGHPSGTRLGVWPEVKMKYAEMQGDVRKSFDYTFDYILFPVARLDQRVIEQRAGKTWRVLRPVVEAGGYEIASEGGCEFVGNFPDGAPLVVEIMTSSTSGGNKRKRSTIPTAFEDAITGHSHQAPGINYRQVWARMVSQLIVKSEVAIGWGGRTIWVLQDVLVDYISSTTALDVHRLLSLATSEVNVLSFSYGDVCAELIEGTVMELDGGKLYAGPITAVRAGATVPSFQDIVRTPVKPPLARLLALLARRAPTNYVAVP